MTGEPTTSPRAALDELVARHGLASTFPAAAMREVEGLLAAPGLDDPALEDWTGRPFVTIDNASSRDLDQALFIERTPEGGFLVHYALADASHYITPASALFQEALARGTSFYLPGFNLPMLPRELSEGLISLNPGVDRRALVFSMALDANGAPLDTRLARARIHSRAKLAYVDVQKLYDAPDQCPLTAEPFADSLLLLRVVGELRVADELARNVVQFDRTELAVSLVETEDGRETFAVEARERLPVERWNEQISLLCNALGARLLAAHEDTEHAQPIFRTHPPPVAERVARMATLVEAIVAQHALDPSVWRWDPQRETIATYLAGLPDDPASAPVRAAIERQILYTNQASNFSPFAGPHHALGLEEYARFSAPMREVVGIFTHKEALELLGMSTPREAALDVALRDAVIAASNRARNVQRALDKEAFGLALDALLGRELALEPDARRAFRAVILGAQRGRLYVRTSSPPLELKVYTEDLEHAFGTRYTLDPAGVALVPEHGEAPALAVGAELVLRVSERDRHGRFRFAIAPPHEVHPHV